VSAVDGRSIRPRSTLPSGGARVSQSEQAYRRLKRDIVTLRLRPGDPISEAQICESLKLGRTPVNQALHRLAHQNLVQILPRKGVLVQPLSMDEFEDIIAARRLIEPACAASAAERLTTAELADIERLLHEAADVSRDDVDAVLANDRHFHDVIAAGGRNRILGEILSGLHDRSARFWAMSLTTGSHLSEVRTEHAHLFERLVARDAGGAREAMEAHIESFRTTLSVRVRPG
jgi:DNA-binding GntR family transcriptional regulator